MALLGKAALAMWWEIDAQAQGEFAHWHAHEHFTERLGITGFCRASRWRQAGGGDGVFVMYELAGHEVLSSPAYLERLNAPSAWSTRMMPLHRHMLRSQCEVLASRGAVTAAHALTVRLSPARAEAADGLREALAALIDELPRRAGLTGAHLLRHRAPAIAQTTEQKIRGGGDGVADWVLVLTGYDAAVVNALTRHELSPQALTAMGGSAFTHSLHELAFAAVPADMA
jgi:hypothetical protein